MNPSPRSLRASRAPLWKAASIAAAIAAVFPQRPVSAAERPTLWLKCLAGNILENQNWGTSITVDRVHPFYLAVDERGKQMWFYDPGSQALAPVFPNSDTMNGQAVPVVSKDVSVIAGKISAHATQKATIQSTGLEIHKSWEIDTGTGAGRQMLEMLTTTASGVSRSYFVLEEHCTRTPPMPIR